MGGTIREVTQDFSQFELTLRQQNILKILSTGGKMSVGDISSHLQNAPAARTLRDDLARLKTRGLIDLEGRAKAARWFLIKK
jgi:DeoR/GlpR family transcriptional regulator of sugar metabolism